MVGQAHLIPQRSASLHVLAQPHLGRQLAARPALLQEDLLAARCRRGVEEVVVAKVFCLPGRAEGPFTASRDSPREKRQELRLELVVCGWAVGGTVGCFLIRQLAFPIGVNTVNREGIPSFPT